MQLKYCPACEQDLPLDCFVSYNSKPYCYCKECHARRNRNYYLQNREKYLAYRRDYHNRNRAKIVQQDRASRLRRKLSVLRHYGNGIAACVCCGVDQVEFLTLDHIDASGADHRKVLKQTQGGNGTGWYIYKWLIDNGCPDGYQTLCFNCNVGKHRSKVNICPHELARQELMGSTISAAQQAA